MAAASSEVNLSLLIKLLKLTSSSNDGEALSAMRKANDQLTKVGGDWETLLRGKVTIIADPFSAIPTPPAQPNTWQPPRPVRSAPPPRAAAPRSPPPPPAPPPPPPRPQTAVVHFTTRLGEWILKSTEPLMVGEYVKVLRRDGQTPLEVVGSLIVKDIDGIHYYNIQGKTKQKLRSSPAKPHTPSASDLIL